MILFAYLLISALPLFPVLYYWRALPAGIAGAALLALSYWPSFFAPVLAPALTAGAIAGERERRTWDMLVVTSLTPAEIIWGKLLSRLMPLLWITIPLVPVALVLLVRGGLEHVSAGFGMGGPVPGAPVTWVFVLGASVSGSAVSFANAVMALYVSLRCSSTRAATMIAYGIAVGAYFFVTMVIGVVAMLVVLPGVMSGSWMATSSSPAGLFPAHTMIWMTAISYAGPLLWGGVVPAVLLPIMLRRFYRINSR